MNADLQRSVLALSERQRRALLGKLRSRNDSPPLVPGRAILAAYVVPRDPVIDVGELRQFLCGVLPQHMVPEAFVVLKELPLTAGGKVDRRALARDLRLGESAGSSAPFCTETERLLGRIWCEVMEIDSVGRSHDFFDLGGHSLLALRLVAKISRAVGQELSVKFLFEHPTIERQADELERRRAGSQPLVASMEVAVPLIQATVPELMVRPALDGDVASFAGGVDAVALGYLGTDMARAMGWDSGDTLSRWFDRDGPVMDGIVETTWGRIVGLTLPYTEETLYHDRDRVVRDILAALEISKRLGAKAVAMTGLIPSATDAGRAVARALAAEPCDGMPALTTGHATTCAAVVLSVERVLEASGRELDAECVAFVGLGSIGVGVLRTMLRCMPHPREIVLCDVYGRAEQLRELREEVVSASGFRGIVYLAPGRGEVSPAVYGASFIVGATSVPDVLDVGRLNPGTIVVDDSAPHCFPVAAAIARFEASADILFSEGGILDVPERVRETAYYPAAIGDSESLAKLIAYLCHDATSITGCVLSGLLTARYGFRPTIGSLSTQDVLEHIAALRKLGFTGGRLRCDGYFPLPDQLAKFRTAFGRR